MSTPRLRPRARLRLCITTTVLILACLTAVAGSSHASEWKGRAMLAVDYQGWSDLENPNGEFDVLHPSVNVLASRRLGDESPWSFSIASEYRAFEYRFDFSSGIQAQVAAALVAGLDNAHVEAQCIHIA